jgi:DNA-binding winged helix-turn-helix (wHTH) protein/TolB-like protein
MVDQLTKHGRYRFGVFDFDADSLELRKHERPVRIRPQALKLLRVLVGRAGDLVSREEIQRELWGNETFVDFEQGVNHGIKQLRAALGDDADAPRYIQTLPRRGYRFIATVERVVQDLTPRVDLPAVVLHRDTGALLRGGRVWAWTLVGVGLVVALLVVGGWRRWGAHPSARASAVPSVAVLPFATSGVPAGAEFAGASLADAVTTRLGLDGKVRVRPAAVVSAYRRRTADAREIGRALGVDYLVLGTLRREGEAYRFDSELMRVGDSGDASDAAVFTVSARDLLELEERVVDQVFASLNANRSRERSQTRSVDAYEAFLQGRFHLSRYTSQDTETAVALFERALASDDSYALAHAGLARAAALMFIRFAPQQSSALWKARAERSAARALALNDRLAEAHEALAAVARYTDFDWDAVISQSVQALRLNPSLDLPHYYLASALQHIGRLDLVEREVAAGLEANPLNLAEAFRLRGVNALWGGQFELSRSYLQRVRELSDKPVSDPHLATALYYLGEPIVAEATLAGLTGSAQVEQRGDALRASFMAARGERHEALALLHRVLSQPYRDHHVVYSVGAAYAGLGNIEDAMRWLQEAVKSGFLCRPWYERDPLLAPLRHVPAFHKLLDDVTRTSDRLAAKYSANQSER